MHEVLHIIKTDWYSSPCHIQYKSTPIAHFAHQLHLIKWFTWYYINITFPAPVIVENIIPRNVIINRGAAEVDNHISRGDIFDYHPSRVCNIQFIIPNRTLDSLSSEVELLLLIDLSWWGGSQIASYLYMLEWNWIFHKNGSSLTIWMLDLITDVSFNKLRHKCWWRQT